MDTSSTSRRPDRDEIATALAEATRVRQALLAFMQAAEKIDNCFIRKHQGTPEGYAETPYGEILVGARAAVDRLTMILSSLTRCQRDHGILAAGDFAEMRREIGQAQTLLTRLGPPPESPADDGDDDED